MMTALIWSSVTGKQRELAVAVCRAVQCASAEHYGSTSTESVRKKRSAVSACYMYAVVRHLSRADQQGCAPCTMVVAASEDKMLETLRAGIKAVAVGVRGSKPIPEELVPQLLQALDELDAESSQDSCAARQRLASFLGTLFVKNEVSGTDETVLRAVAARRPHLQGSGKQRGGCSSEQILAA
eukprot:18200-Heterococcus_DN1.PRE.1